MNTLPSSILFSLEFLADPNSLWWNIVTSITDGWKLAAFGIAAIMTIVLMVRRRSVPSVVWIVILLLVIIPIAASVYQSLVQSKNDAQAIYRVRITLIDPQKFPVNEAKVTSSFGGEAKKVEGGWEIDIPSASKPKDGKLTIYAEQRNAALQGEFELALAGDYNPAVTIQLKPDKSAKVRGQIVDNLGNAVAGARVWVVGYGDEGIITQDNGHFELPAHQPIGQQVELHAEKRGYKPVNQFHPAGDDAVTLVLLK